MKKSHLDAENRGENKQKMSEYEEPIGVENKEAMNEKVAKTNDNNGARRKANDKPV